MRRNMEVWTQFAAAALARTARPFHEAAGGKFEAFAQRFDDAADEAAHYADALYEAYERRMKQHLDAAAPGPEVLE